MSRATVKKQVSQALETLSEPELEQVVEYISYLRFRQRVAAPPAIDMEHLKALYAEFAEEDRELAEAGMAGYQDLLLAEDRH
jgi:hypothetical protein